MKICIIIPAYNEEKRIARTLDDYCGFFSERKMKQGLDFEILIVINNTTDRTEEIVRKYQDACKELKYLNFKQGGKGFAVIEGLKYSLARDFNIIGFTDADDSTDAENFYKIIKSVNGYAGAIGSRYVKGSIMRPKQPVSRILASRIFNFIVRSLFLMPYKDTQCGGKIFKRKAIESILDRLSITQWAFDIDLLYQINRRGFMIKEAPISWRDTEASKINLIRSSIQMFFAVLQLRMLNSPFEDFWKALKPAIRVLYKIVK